MPTFGATELALLANRSPFLRPSDRRHEPVGVGQIRKLMPADPRAESALVIVLAVNDAKAVVALVDTEADFSTIWDIVLPTMNDECHLVVWPDSRMMVDCSRLTKGPVLRVVNLDSGQAGKLVPFPGDMVSRYRSWRVGYYTGWR